MSSKRQITLPLHVLEATRLGPGDELRVEVDRAGRIVLTPARPAFERRQAIEETAGMFTGVWAPDSLDRLRDEWRS